MAISNEEAEKIKEHLLKQLANFPEDKRTQIKEQINSMNTEQVEKFIDENQLAHLGGNCIFCSIVSGKRTSIKIGENNSNIAVLELNPLSKGHSLVIPIEHSKTIFESSNALANQISKRLKEKFKPKEIKINEIEIMEHKLLEVIPIYGNEEGRKQVTEKELNSIQEEILKAPSPTKPESEETIGKDILEVKKVFIPKIPPRIP
jgi:histidine triad (HIT) family protein